MEAQEYSIAASLDLKGLLCPMPIVKISKAIKGVEIGDVIDATATDPGVMMDVPAWCKTSGNELISLDQLDDGTFRFVVRRIR